VRECTLSGPDPAAGNINLSAIEGNGDIGKDVRIGKLPNGDVPPTPNPDLPASVGVNSGPSSNDKNREDNNDSSSSSWKLGVERY
jgi:hypothetical protein